MRLPIATIIVMALAAGTALGQAPPPAAPPAAAPAAAPGQTAVPAPPPVVDTFTYNPEGRRDPFVSLLSRTERRGSQSSEGIAGLAVDDLSVRGIVSSPNGFVAMVAGPNGKSFLVRPNDRLLDGTIKSITAQGLVILQDVNDPLSLVKQKEVRKLLHGNEEGK